ncbi:MAG: DUF2911 domain-containing protein [Gemmatimonadota bacterium]|nr:DUF2911 domain-containing protein [Gemmatimonadota bacterium]
MPSRRPLAQSWILLSILSLAAACGSGDQSPMACRMDGPREGIAQRPSPFDSIMISTGSAVRAKLCFSRPFARGRAVMGGLVPFDTLWRTGANEPTIIHFSEPAEIAGFSVEPGEYSIYTVPSADEWRVVINASTDQWGLTQDAYGAEGNFFPNAYTDDVRAQELGRTPVEIEEVPVTDQLTAIFDRVDDSRYRLLIDWETTRIVVPLRLLGTQP